MWIPRASRKGGSPSERSTKLRLAGIPAAMVNAGGDVVAYGEPEPGRQWRIGVRDPRSAGALLTVVELDAALATSGTYERGHHVLDPRSGHSPQGLLSATSRGRN